MPANTTKKTKRQGTKKAGASSKKANTAKSTKKAASRTAKSATTKASSKPKATKRPAPAKAKAKAKTPRTMTKGSKELRKSPTTEVTGEVLEFINALNAYKKEKNCLFPAHSEILEVLKSLGYKKT
ncbi:MAG: hypothetical protein H6832_08675 [Planctomycetes bacterium]|nr:hypothetical protein [Planctomycetota bacterium]MCB9918464.1 hypothetical protein [Planctomycetota bacterium]